SPRCASAVPSYQSNAPPPLIHAPPCSQTTTGRRLAPGAGVHTVRCRQSSDCEAAKSPIVSRNLEGRCGCTRPGCVAFREPTDCTGSGGQKRKLPMGGCAKGIALKRHTVSCCVPVMSP